MGIDRRLDEAYRVATEESDLERALSICDEVIATNPELAKPYVERARIRELAGDIANAIADVSRAIALEPGEPDYYFNRARWYLGIGDFDKSIADSSSAIEVGLRTGFDYYDETSRFFRAAALIGVNRYGEALRDLEGVRDNFVTYSTGVGRLEKKDLIEKANEGLLNS